MTLSQTPNKLDSASQVESFVVGKQVWVESIGEVRAIRW